ncbi:MAG: peptidyl-prolyl cis-trans isomerase [Terriglobales bacterium]
MIRFLQTPGKTKKIVLGGLLVIICGAMVVTLVPGGMLGDAFGFSNLEKGVLAKVGSQEVTMTEVDQTARRIGRQQFGGRTVPATLVPLLRQAAAEQLITQKALIVEAERMGFKVTDQELQNTLQKGQFGQIFFPNGQYVGDQQYEMVINSQFNMSIPQFEQALKTDLLLNKLRTAVEGPVSISKQDIADEFKKENTKVKFEYAVLSLDDIEKQIKPVETELKSYYESHKQQYTNAIPEKRQVRYVVIDTAKLANQVQVTNADLQSYYRDRQDQYRVPDQVDVRHILIKTPLPGPDGKVDQNAVKAAEKKAEDVLAKLKAGGNFADLAKKYSDDTASAQNGGSLGWIQKGRTVPEFEKAAFSLKPGETSGIVQSSYGFHIIHVDGKQEAHLKSLDEVKPEIEPIVRQQKAAAVADRLAGSVLSQARSNSLDKAAQANNLEVINSNYITRTDTLPGVGMAPQLMDAIFAAAAKGSPETASMPTGTVVYQVTDVKPPATPTFEEIRARVESDYKGDKAQSLLMQKTVEMAQNARNEHDLKKAAKQAGATVKTSDFVTSSGQVPDLGGMGGPASVAFTLKPGEISGPLNAGRGGAVLSLLERQEPTPEEIAKGSDQMRETLVTRKRGDAFQLFAAGLRKRLEQNGKIRINKDEMTRLANAKSEAGY